MNTRKTNWRPANSQPGRGTGRRAGEGAGRTGSLTIRHGRWAMLAALLLAPMLLFAQQYSIDWYKVAGGGGTSTSATYQVTGTLGQPDASGALTGGGYSLTGGYWSLISAVPTPGTPNLTITRSGTSVIISWPATGSYTLQQNGNLSVQSGWATSGYSVSTANGTNSITITSPVGALFFRLSNP